MERDKLVSTAYVYAADRVLAYALAQAFAFTAKKIVGDGSTCEIETATEILDGTFRVAVRVRREEKENEELPF